MRGKFEFILRTCSRSSRSCSLLFADLLAEFRGHAVAFRSHAIALCNQSTEEHNSKSRTASSFSSAHKHSSAAHFTNCTFHNSVEISTQPPCVKHLRKLSELSLQMESGLIPESLYWRASHAHVQDIVLCLKAKSGISISSELKVLKVRSPESHKREEFHLANQQLEHV